MQLKSTLSGWLSLLALMLTVTACQPDEIDIAANTDFPPAILSAFPAPDGRVVAGDFDVRVEFADGSISPLQSATVMLMDSAMTEIASLTKDLSGIQDSLVIEGSSFDAANLALGIYNMSVSVTDSRGQTTEQSYSFEISNLPFAANHDKMYIAGAFNGWPADAAGLEGFELTLVDDHIWEIREIELEAGGWKLKNTIDWTDEDWGDADCDGFMTSNSVGNDNTDCGNSGLVNIRFNDETLSYSVAEAVTLASNTMSLYLLGTFNNFQGNEYQFTLTDDNTWFLEEVLLAPGDQYKMAEMPDFIGINYGDDNNDGVAQVGGGNFVRADSTEEAFYSISFNDRTLAYDLEVVRLLFPDNMGIIGSATPTGWDSDTDMTVESPGVYTITIDLLGSIPDTLKEVKFRANDDWAINYGGDDFPNGTAVAGGGNIPVSESGTYDVTLNLNDNTYTFELNTGPQSIGIIGDATPGGWAEDTDLTDNGDGTWSTILALGAGAVKFRADNAWDDDWGGTSFPDGTAEYKGGDITATPGIYRVVFDLENLTYSFEPLTIGIIGSATPTGWTSDTDLVQMGDDPGVYGTTITLTTGVDADKVKFRANDEWIYDWGDNDDAFPTGVAEFKGGDITVTEAGEYTITFNVNTLEYAFTK
jgi:hypothetical protein